MRLGRIGVKDATPSRHGYTSSMSRWAPDARQRLESAALQLFAEKGYDETTVAQIADRAGLNRATFFRHFADKREVLFGAEDRLAELFADGIRSAPSGASLTDLLGAALAAAACVMTPEQRSKAVQRVRALAANVEVQERALLKHSRIATSLSSALQERSIDEVAARLGAEAGLLAFSIAIERWITSDDRPFAMHAEAALRAVQEGAGELTNRLCAGTAAPHQAHTAS
jgi:AcrR family transcriptional regulator